MGWAGEVGVGSPQCIETDTSVQIFKDIKYRTDWQKIRFGPGQILI